MFPWHLTFIAKAMRWSLFLLLRKPRPGRGELRAQTDTHLHQGRPRGERPGKNPWTNNCLWANSSCHFDRRLWSQAALVQIPALPSTYRQSNPGQLLKTLLILSYPICKMGIKYLILGAAQGRYSMNVSHQINRSNVPSSPTPRVKYTIWAISMYLYLLPISLPLLPLIGEYLLTEARHAFY